MKNLIIIFSVLTTTLFAQQSAVKGLIYDDKGSPLTYATAVLLNPADSTLLYYGISDSQGAFEIKNVSSGKYLLQASFLGYESYFKSISVPVSNGNIGIIVLKQAVQTVGTVNVVAERIPILIKQDTVEYNARCRCRRSAEKASRR